MKSPKNYPVQFVQEISTKIDKLAQNWNHIELRIKELKQLQYIKTKILCFIRILENSNSDMYQRKWRLNWNFEFYVRVILNGDKLMELNDYTDENLSSYNEANTWYQIWSIGNILEI